MWNKIVDYYIDDGISGKNLQNRPEVTRLINDVKLGKINNVLVYKLDRLTRSVKDLIYLIELFDECQLNNVVASLAFKPEKIIFLGYKKVMNVQKTAALKKFFEIKT